MTNVSLESALNEILRGLPITTTLTDKYLLLVDNNGDLVAKAKASTDYYNHVIIGDLN